jgi:hypothetical protein
VVVWQTPTIPDSLLMARRFAGMNHSQLLSARSAFFDRTDIDSIFDLDHSSLHTSKFFRS